MNAAQVKFLFLHSNNEPKDDDLKALDTLGSLLLFRDSFLNQNSGALFASYDVVVLDISNKQYKDWFSSYRNVLSTNVNVKIIFLYQPHVHIDDNDVKALRNDWKATSIIKQIPKAYIDKADLISKLINNIHLAGLDVPQVESCFKSALYAIAQKFGCN